MKHSILAGLVLSILLTFSVTPIYSIICDKPPCLYSSGHFGDIAPAASDLIYEVYSSGGTSMNPPIANTFTLETARTITCIATYHFPGYTPGTIGLLSSSGDRIGPWQAEGFPGMGEKPNRFWVAYFNQVLPPGTYTITDSGQSTWSYDPSDCIASKGICPSKGICQVYAANMSETNPEKNVQGGSESTPINISGQQGSAAINGEDDNGSINTSQFNIETSSSVAESNAALQKIAGYLESGDIESFNSSLSMNAHALISGHPNVPVDRAAKIGQAIKDSRVTAASMDIVFYEAAIDGTDYSFDMVKEGGAWKLDQF